MADRLYNRAFAQDGDPIPRGKVVRVELVRGDDEVIEGRDFDRATDPSILTGWLNHYAVRMIAEGKAGAVRWTGSIDPEED